MVLLGFGADRKIAGDLMGLILLVFQSSTLNGGDVAL